jgi:hypothetical protein
MTRFTRAIALLGLFLSIPALAVVGQPSSVSGGAAAQAGAAGSAPVVLTDSRHDASPPLRAMPLLPAEPIMGQAIAPGPLPGRPGLSPEAHEQDPLLQALPGLAALPSPRLNFNGLDNGDGLLPPDPNGDIGYDPATGVKYYVQMVNVSFAVWDVTGAPTRIYGPARNNTLWQGFGGPCEATNNGDPIVLFDPLAYRWLMSQFSLPKNSIDPYYQCIAISQTPDPRGIWYRYQFKISDTKMNDYAKFGVWTDGYYMSINQFNRGISWAGAGAIVFERNQLLQGQTARMIYFDLYSVDSNLGGLLPADLDGSPPPAGAPNPFVAVDDDGRGRPLDQLEIWNFHTDWVTPNNSTFNKVAALATAPFDSHMCGDSRSCIPQPGTTVGVDAIADRLMYRLQYRNLGTYQTLVANHTVDVNGADRAGVRWYELRKPGSNWSIYQQGTYAPGADYRWMGSMAMNGSGDIALGYSVSSSSVYPSVRYTGRLAGDPLDQMTLGEGALVAGSGSQTHSASRWGDYSMMAVDPADDCTFWYTQEYYDFTSPASWRTRIGAFQLADCTPPPVLRSLYLPVILNDAGPSLIP